MNKWLLAAGAGLALLIFARRAVADTVQTGIRKMSGIKGYQEHDALMRAYAARYAIDWRLLKAHVYMESAGNPSAINPSDPSYGLGQVLCTNGNQGMNAPCANKFPAVKGWIGMTPTRLLSPSTNLDIAAQIIADNVKRWGIPRAIAVYNSWSERHAPQAGPFGNQRYVDKVLQYYAELQS